MRELPPAFLVAALGPAELTKRLEAAAGNAPLILAALDPLAARGGWPAAPVLHPAELRGYAGVVVSTCPATAGVLRTLNVASAAHYCWGPDWLDGGFSPESPYVCRSASHAALAAAAWGRPPAFLSLYPDPVRFANPRGASP